MGSPERDKPAEVQISRRLSIPQSDGEDTSIVLDQQFQTPSSAVGHSGEVSEIEDVGNSALHAYTSRSRQQVCDFIPDNLWTVSGAALSESRPWFETVSMRIHRQVV